MNTMNYKGYIARIEYSTEDDEFVASVANTERDEIYFSGKTDEELKKHMREVIDSHIENCNELGIEPEKPHHVITEQTTDTVALPRALNT